MAARDGRRTLAPMAVFGPIARVGRGLSAVKWTRAYFAWLLWRGTGRGGRLTPVGGIALGIPFGMLGGALFSIEMLLEGRVPPDWPGPKSLAGAVAVQLVWGAIWGAAAGFGFSLLGAVGRKHRGPDPPAESRPSS